MIVNNNKDYQRSRKMNRKHITLAYCWGTVNIGDKAITPGTLEMLRQTFPESKITVISFFSEDSQQFHESASYISKKYPDVIFLPNFVSTFSTPFKYLTTVSRFGIFFLSLLFPKISYRIFHIQAIDALTKSDFVISNGGHLFFWSRQMGEKRGNLLYAYPVIMARRLGVPYGLYAQSFGPFEFGYLDKVVKLFYRWLFSGSRFIYTRESKSRSVIYSLIDKSGCDFGTVLDSAFFLKDEDDQKAKAILDKYNLTPKSFIALTLRLTKRGSSKKLEEEKYNKYSKKIICFLVQWIEEKKIPVAIVCQVPGDITDSEFVYEYLPDKYKDYCKVITDPLSPEALKSLYKNARILLGMRFHSLIFALSENTPVLGLYYYDIGPKILGMMGDLGFQNYVFNIEDVSGEDLFKKADKLYQNRNELSKEIEQKLDRMKKQSFDAMKKIGRYI